MPLLRQQGANINNCNLRFFASRALEAHNAASDQKPCFWLLHDRYMKTELHLITLSSIVAQVLISGYVIDVGATHWITKVCVYDEVRCQHV